MRPEAFFLRCFAERRHHQWQGFCIDLNLAAQGDSLEEVEHTLEAMIAEYVYDALEGEDREYGPQLMRRKAPLSLRWRYYFYFFLTRFSHWRSEMGRTFQVDPHRNTIEQA